ncbi:MAG: TIGR00266 family protein [Leptospirales bacterium]
MKYNIIGRPDFASIVVNMQANEKIQAESGAMVSMSPNISIETSARGGVLSSLKRKVFSGESFFQNTFTCENSEGELMLTSPSEGDIVHRKLQNEEIILSRGAYVCGDTELQIDSKWGGFKSFFSGEGLFFLKVSGTGDLFFASFGAVEEIDISGDYIVDTGHIVGFEPSLNYKIEKVGGLKSLFLSGEGLVCRFSGQGKVYIQTRNHNSFARWANTWRRVQKSGS